MIDRLFKSGMATTLLGIVFALAGGWMYLRPEFTSMEAGEMMIIAFVFLRSKNSLIGLSNDNGSNKVTDSK